MSYRSTGFVLSLTLHAFVAAGIYQWQQQDNDEPEVSRQASKAVRLSMAMFQALSQPVKAEPIPVFEKKKTDSKAVVLNSSTKSQNPKPVVTEQPLPKAKSESKPKPVQAPKPKPKPKPKPIEPISPTPLLAAKPPPKKKMVIPAPPKAVIAAEPAVITAPEVQGSTANSAQKAQADAVRQGVENAYKNAVRVEILKQRKYPRQARRKHKEGIVYVSFQLNRKGELNNLRVVESSGDKQLDQAALDAVRKVERFPAIPAAAKREVWNFELPVNFDLSA